MQFPDLSQLPPWAVVLFVVSLAIVVGLVWLGERVGKRSPASSQNAAQVAAVIVDPTALNKAADEVAGLAVAITEATVSGRAHTAAIDRQSEKIGQLIAGIDDLRTEVIRSAAKLK